MRVYFSKPLKQRILDRLDAIECDAFRLYLRIRRVRLGLQAGWQMLPDGGGRELRYLSDHHRQSEATK